MKKPAAVTNEMAQPPTSSSQPQLEESNRSVRGQILQWLNSKASGEKQRQKTLGPGNEFDVHVMVKTRGTRYKRLFIEMARSVEALNQGYECLELFREAEEAARGRREMACAKGFSVGKVKFVMRKQFYGFKNLMDDLITPSRFASIVTLAADQLFREKLLPDAAAMMSAYPLIKNPLAVKHGFTVDRVPETVEQMKLYYYYLTTTIGVHVLMETHPHLCMAIAKWRLDGKHPKQLRLYNDVLYVDEAYVTCLRLIRCEAQANIPAFHFNPDDLIRNESLLREVLKEFKFLKTFAVSPTG